MRICALKETLVLLLNPGKIGLAIYGVDKVGVILPNCGRSFEKNRLPVPAGFPRVIRDGAANNIAKDGHCQ